MVLFCNTISWSFFIISVMNWNLDRKSFHMTYQPAAMQTRTSARERIRVSAAKTRLSSPFVQGIFTYETSKTKFTTTSR